MIVYRSGMGVRGDHKHVKRTFNFSDGFVLVSAVWDHKGHTLSAEAAEVMASRGTAFLPQVLMDLGADAANAGMSVKEMDNFLRKAAKTRDLPVTWEPSHLRSRFNIRSSATDFDLTGFMETLKEREKEGLVRVRATMQPRGSGYAHLRAVGRSHEGLGK